MPVIKTMLLSVIFVTACCFLGLWLYWRSERPEVYQAAESQLSVLFKQKHVSVQKVEIVPFKLNTWTIVYQFPYPMRQGQMVNSTALLVRDAKNRWVLKSVEIPK